MDTFLFSLGAAFWLGVTTSISPCPLAANIAAISYVGRRAGSVRSILSAGLLYTLGRMITYLIVGFVVTKSLLSIPHVSMFLQTNMNKILGPLLIVVALVLFGLVDFSTGGGGMSERIRKRVDKAGIWGALILGLIFALTFCPVSAALFFGSLIPIAVRHSSTVLVPSVYGIGTAIPVLVFAVVMAISVQAVGKVFTRLTAIELWIRRVMAVIFLGAGVYMTLVHTLKLF
ncbi:MAG: cytochrome C biogenesis protein [Elusimicrobia bacterium RIFOXYB2_FULL_49_7]|nr:MAG: cytochrome C biogenesis protein [Elusimicrobia bacterium RIFOXYB2_FULL_49_7]